MQFGETNYGTGALCVVEATVEAEVSLNMFVSSLQYLKSRNRFAFCLK